MKKFFLRLVVLLLLIISSVVAYKGAGISYCYIKTPETKEEANKVISFCSDRDLFFYDMYSESLANIYEKYPDNFHNENSASMLISHYIQNNPNQHLDKIEKLTNLITDDNWRQGKGFLFVLQGGYFEESLPLDFRRKTFNKIYERYTDLIKNDKKTDPAIKKMALQDMDFLYNKINKIQ